MNIKIWCTLIIIVFSFSCTSTNITSSWRQPDKEIVVSNLKKVLVVAFLDSETSRRKAEDQMVSYLNGKGIVSYNYLKEGFDKKNEDAIRKKIKADGFDGAITMRLIDVEKDEQYVRGNRSNFPIYYQNFSGYYHNMWSFYQTPGYFTTTKIYTIESNVYSIKDDKIIWSGLTETTNPDGVKKMTAEVAQAVYKQMIKEGFINKS